MTKSWDQRTARQIYKLANVPGFVRSFVRVSVVSRYRRVVGAHHPSLALGGTETILSVPCSARTSLFDPT